MPVTGVPYLVGLSLAAFVVNMAIASLVALAHEDVASANLFFLMACFTAFGAMLLVLSFRSHRSRYSVRTATILILILTLLLPIPAAAPFYLLGASETRLDALFEAVSSITTTGFSFLLPAESLSEALLYWRSSLQWLGGYFTLIVMVAVLSNITLSALPLSRPNLELIDESSLVERIEKTAIRLLPIYSVLTVFCYVLLVMSGVDVFHALCVSLATVSTGGAAPIDDTVDALGGSLVQIVILVFMFIGAMNVATQTELARGRTRAFLADGELLYLLVMVAVLTGFQLISEMMENIAVIPILSSLFNAVSVVTTTGFAAGGSQPFDAMPLPLLLLGMFLGGAALSTAGGLKGIRALIFFRHSMSDMRGLTHPRRIKNLKFNNLAISQQSLSFVWLYFFLLIIVIALLAMCLAGSGLAFELAFSLSLMSVSNCGALAHFLWPADLLKPEVDTMGKIAMMIGMILGRLEIILLLLPFQRRFWQA